MQLACGIYEASLSRIAAASQSVREPKLRTKFDRRRFGIEKTVRSPFTSKSVFIDRAYLTAGFFLFFKDKKLMAYARFFQFLFYLKGSGESGYSGAYDSNLLHQSSPFREMFPNEIRQHRYEVVGIVQGFGPNQSSALFFHL